MLFPGSGTKRLETEHMQQIRAVQGTKAVGIPVWGLKIVFYMRINITKLVSNSSIFLLLTVAEWDLKTIVRLEVWLVLGSLGSEPAPRHFTFIKQFLTIQHFYSLKC